MIESEDLHAILDSAREELKAPEENGVAYATALCLYVLARRLLIP